MLNKIMAIVEDNPSEESLKSKFKKIFHKDDDDTVIILFSNEKVYVVSEIKNY